MKLTLFFLFFFIPFFSLSADAGSESASTNETQLEEVKATLSIWNRDIYTFKYAAQKGTVEYRVKLIEEEIKKLSSSDLQETVFYIKRDSLFGQKHNVIMLGNEDYPETAKVLFSLYQGDLDDGKELDKESAIVVQRLKELFRAKSEQEKLPVILKGLMYTVFACIILVVFFKVSYWVREKVLKIFSKKVFNFIPKIKGLNAHELCYDAVQFLVKLPFWCLNLLLIYLWIIYILSQFPYTIPWAESFGVFFVSKLLIILKNVMSSIPGIIMAALIFYFVYISSKVVNAVFLSIENKKLETQLFDAADHATKESVVWSGQSELTDPSSAESAARSYSK